MTAKKEAEWLRCKDPQEMLERLREGGIASERKLRWLAAACCQHAWRWLDPDSRAVVETLERLADGAASEAELRAALWANRGCQDIDARMAVDYAALGACRPALALLAAVCGRRSGGASSPSILPPWTVHVSSRPTSSAASSALYLSVRRPSLRPPGRGPMASCDILAAAAYGVRHEVASVEWP